MDMRSLLTLSVTLLPKFPQVYAGDDVTLVCNHKKEIKPTKWFINGTPQSHENYSMLLTSVTPINNGTYQCEQDGLKSDPYTLTVLELEPHAQLSPSIGGAVMTKGDGRNLVLQVDDDLKDWACFVLRGESGFALGVDVYEKAKRGVIFAELKETERATFWCKKKKTELRSNAVTLKMTELMVMLDPPAVPALQGEPVALRCVVWGGPELERAVFYKDQTKLTSSPEGTYTITNATQDDNGKYSCRATYRFSHISAEAARREGDSDTQELKVIGGPPAAAVISDSHNSLKCSCPHCPADCTSYLWYHTPLNDPYERRKLSGNNSSITVKEDGLYSCRVDCGKGFSRLSNIYRYKVEFGGLLYILIGLAVLIILTVLIVWILKRRICGGTNVQASGRDQLMDMRSLLTLSGGEQGTETNSDTKNNGEYQCEQDGSMSDPLELTVLELEPHAQLSPSIGGAVMTKGDGRNLVLKTDDDLKDWACFVLRGESGFALEVNVDEKMKRAVIFAELKEAERATFWCNKKGTTLRSNAVTLKKTEHMVMLVPPAVPALQGETVALRCVVWAGPKLENVIFYKDTKVLTSSPEDTYTITNATQDDNGKYSCRATYRFSQISAEATQQEGDSDAQEFKVIVGPPAAVISESDKTLKCSCPRCPADCTSYLWYHTPLNDPYERRKLSENDQSSTVEEEGLYSCRSDCGTGFSRFSNIYRYKG
ncbi:high affinity immunoglobulin gamma Fc receptor I-like isoform X1 [Labeo rohita]|nr:high affinity immunoglobulin gamma Fc receptor I-like isoform X1 [Labeo rohita]